MPSVAIRFLKPTVGNPRGWFFFAGTLAFDNYLWYDFLATQFHYLTL